MTRPRRRLRLVLRAAVPQDLINIHAFLADRSPEQAERFLLSVRATMEQLTEFPGLGGLRPFRGKLRGVRSWAVAGFPNHLIFYRPTQEAVIVLGVIHGARNVQRLLRDRSQ
jgi:toxin ParE1/3/4